MDLCVKESQELPSFHQDVRKNLGGQAVCRWVGTQAVSPGREKISGLEAEASVETFKR